jgi:hypothetical protein
MNYESVLRVESKCMEGVRYAVRRMSFGRRVELIRQVRDLASKAECLEAGSNSREKVEASLLSAEVERIYLLWGLAGVEGLAIDGEPASAEMLIANGPEELCAEVLAAIKSQFGLSEDERKN